MSEADIDGANQEGEEEPKAKSRKTTLKTRTKGRGQEQGTTSSGQPNTTSTTQVQTDGDEGREGSGTITEQPAAAANLPILAHVEPGETRGECWERLRKLARAAGLPKGQGPGTAYQWANDQVSAIWRKEPEPVVSSDPEPAAPAPADDAVLGLGDIPASWPELPANASLQVEIAWVSANRLRVRDGRGVDLSRALSPAPSYSALSWLETSILFPSKFADISVKATAQTDDEKEEIRRERFAIEEIRGILAEMMEAAKTP